MTITINYVDGTQQTAPITEWSNLQSEGVDLVTITDVSGSVKLSGASLYWVYEENEQFVAGCGSVRYDHNPITEIIFNGHGGQIERKREYVPDLLHRHVKLGHWRPNGANV